MNTVLVICIGTLFLILQGSLQAADHKCQTKPEFEKPDFVSSVRDAQKRQNIGREKPSFEKAQFEKTQLNRPTFVKAAFEKPAFVQDCIVSVSPKGKNPQVSTKDSVRVPVDAGKEWGRIRMDRHRLHVIPHHELKIRRSSIYR